MAAKTMLSTLQGLADTFHRREQDAHREAIDRTCGRTDARSLGRESANASARQLVLDRIRELEKGEGKPLGREAYEIANELAHRLQRAEIISDADARRVMPLLEGWVRISIGPIIDEREEAVGDVLEMSKGWQYRLARFLRKLADLVRDS
jgi:hypothetical protein